MNESQSLDPMRAIINQYLAPLPEPVQVAVALVRDRRVDFIGVQRASKGFVSLDNRRAVFEIGSATKVFTALLLAQAVEEGILHLDTPVQDLLPFRLRETERDGVAVTLRHLANHTSGMVHQPPGLNAYAFLHGHPREPFRDYTQERFEQFLKFGLKLAFTPGTKYSYSNMGMSLVGYILSYHYGKSYEELLQTRLFQRLGVKYSTTLLARVKEHVVPGWEKAGISAPNWDMFALSPAGGLKTCADDFARFAQLQFSGDPAAALTQVPTFTIRENYYVGLGWHLIDRKDGERWANHGGGMLGYTANININVKRKFATIVLSNLGSTLDWPNKIFELGRDLLVELEKNPLRIGGDEANG